MSASVPHETRVTRAEEARAYAGLDEAAFRNLRRRYRKKIEPVEFILAWRDGEKSADIAGRFGLRHEDSVNQARRAMGLRPRGPRGKTT